MGFFLIVADLQSSHRSNHNPVNLFPLSGSADRTQILQVDRASVSICVFIRLYTLNSELEQQDTWHAQTSIQRIG